MTKRIRLHPSHQHEWEPIPGQPMVRCTVCEFQAPRRLANLDGVVSAAVVDVPVPRYLEADLQAWVDEPDTDIRCTHRDAAGQCLDHQGHPGDHQHPAQTQSSSCWSSASPAPSSPSWSS